MYFLRIHHLKDQVLLRVALEKHHEHPRIVAEVREGPLLLPFRKLLKRLVVLSVENHLEPAPFIVVTIVF